jgi:hypothetical protein
VATTSAAAVAAAAARLHRVDTSRPAAPEAHVFNQRGVIPPHMARLMQQQQARGNPTQGSCLSGFGGFQSQQPTQQQQQQQQPQQGGSQAFTFPAQGGRQPAQPGVNATSQFLPLGGVNYQPIHQQQYPYPPPPRANSKEDIRASSRKGTRVKSTEERDSSTRMRRSQGCGHGQRAPGSR